LIRLANFDPGKLPVRSCLIDGEAIVCDANCLAVFDLLRRQWHGNDAILCAFAGTALASAPARANCERSALGTMCEWEEQIAVREWLERQRNGALPYIAYHSGDNIGVDYNAGDTLDETNRREAAALVEIYCKGKYRIILGNPGHIDAVCVH
jgi:hypothetical protein